MRLVQITHPTQDRRVALVDGNLLHLLGSHRTIYAFALAAATASSIHMSGPGKFYISGLNARFVNVEILNRCVQDMVKMSSLQGYVFEVVPNSDEVALVGAVVNAMRGELVCQ